MELQWVVRHIFLTCLISSTLALPSVLLDEIKASETTTKVKRAHSDLNNAGERVREIPFFNEKPSLAAKRGANLKNPTSDQQNEWEQTALYQTSPESLSNLQSTLYNPDFDNDGIKSVAEYEKGFHYGTNKDKLDEALENAILKSELYGEPPVSSNQYRYYDEERRRRRRRRDTKKIKLTNSRIKREIELTPEEILTILTLYENDRIQHNNPFRSGTLYDSPLINDLDQNDDNNEENWLDSPVYPHSINDIGPSYQYEEKRGRWGGLAPLPYDARKKRFMVAKKRNDPTRELRYLNGFNRNNDYYTLSQLLSNQREPNNNVPLYHRYVL